MWPFGSVPEKTERPLQDRPAFQSQSESPPHILMMGQFPMLPAIGSFPLGPPSEELSSGHERCGVTVGQARACYNGGWNIENV